MKTRVVIFAGGQGGYPLEIAVAALPDACVHRTEGWTELLNAIAMAHNGHQVCSARIRELANLADGDFPQIRYTAEERAVGKLVAAGWTTSEIAEELKLGVRTTDRRRSSIMEKAGCAGNLAGFGCWMAGVAVKRAIEGPERVLAGRK
ncbi:MAG: hypothetical protein WA771_07340 [Chthoniobacterales bacterium]